MTLGSATKEVEEAAENSGTTRAAEAKFQRRSDPESPPPPATNLLHNSTGMRAREHRNARRSLCYLDAGITSNYGGIEMTTATNKPTKVVTAIRPEFRDVTRVPAEIAKRANLLADKMGREAFFRAFAVGSHQLLEDALAGRLEASWKMWASWQAAERLCRQIVNGGRPYARPMTQREDGSWLAAPLVGREQAETDAICAQANPPKAPKRRKPKAQALPANVVTFPESRRVRWFADGRGGPGPKRAA